MQEAQDLGSDEIDLTENGRNIEILQTENGKPKIKITAPATVRYQGTPPYTEFPKGMKIYVYNEAGEIENELTAEKGKTADNSEEVEAQGNVVITNKAGDIMKTEKLVWDQKKKKLVSEDKVEIRTKE